MFCWVCCLQKMFDVFSGVSLHWNSRNVKTFRDSRQQTKRNRIYKNISECSDKWNVIWFFVRNDLTVPLALNKRSASIFTIWREIMDLYSHSAILCTRHAEIKVINAYCLLLSFYYETKIMSNSKWFKCSDGYK